MGGTNTSKKNDLKPPAGFSFRSKFKVDKEYTNCDEDGWSYGIDFWQLSSNYTAGGSVASPMGCSVRRRKWVRDIEEDAAQLSLLKSIQLGASTAILKKNVKIPGQKGRARLYFSLMMPGRSLDFE